MFLCYRIREIVRKIRFLKCSQEGRLSDAAAELCLHMRLASFAIVDAHSTLVLGTATIKQSIPRRQIESNNIGESMLRRRVREMVCGDVWWLVTRCQPPRSAHQFPLCHFIYHDAILVTQLPASRPANLTFSSCAFLVNLVCRRSSVHPSRALI